MTIVNTRIPVQQVKAGDLIVAVHILAASPPRTLGVVAEVREVIRYGSEYTLRYGVIDSANGLGYGSDITLHRGDKITRLSTTN